MVNFRLTFITLLLTLVFSYSPANAETVTIVADHWCPYNCTPKSEHPGFMIEIAREAFAAHNINVEYKVIPWKEAIEKARLGNFDAIVGATYKDAPDFIFPSFQQGFLQNTFYVAKGDKWRFTNIDSLKNISLGVVEDYAYSNLLDNYIASEKDNKYRIRMESGEVAFENNLKNLISGKVRVIVDAKYVATYYLKTHEMQNTVEEAGKLSPSEQDNLYIAFSPASDKAHEYADILSKETKIMRSNGKLAKILKYYGIEDWDN